MWYNVHTKTCHQMSVKIISAHLPHHWSFFNARARVRRRVDVPSRVASLDRVTLFLIEDIAFFENRNHLAAVCFTSIVSIE